MSQGPLAPAFGTAVGPMSGSQSGTLHPGTPVYPDGTGRLLPARANASGTCDGVVGLLAVPAVANQEAPYKFAGDLALTTEQWDAVTGDSGGLTPGARYFVSSATAGKLTSAFPTSGGTFRQQVGIALSANIMQIQIGGPAVDLF